jgi:circadian clock protein KaiC
MISSLMDTWILVAVAEKERQRGRLIYVLKSRGMPHSDEVRHFRFTTRGIELLPSRPTKIAATPKKARKTARRKS